MSGPKCDEYTLSRQERLKQQREYERRLAKEREEARKRAEEKRKEELRKKNEQFNAGVDAGIKELMELKRAKLEKESEAFMDEFFDAVSDYEAAAALAGIEPAECSFDIETVEKDIETLKAETEKLKALEVDNMCRREVNKIFEETLEEMGYEVLAEKDNGHAAAVLYKYDEDTAINVLNTGSRFVMEVVAVDKCDRAPSESETKELTEKMHSFCNDYEDLKDKLSEDSRLVRKSVYHMPPDEKYARVVNSEAYKGVSKNKARYERSTTGEGEVRKKLGETV